MNKESNIFKTIVTILLALLILGLAAGTVSASTQEIVNLGTAGNFVILSKSGISTTGTTSIVGDVGVSPIDSTAITGFGLNVFTRTSKEILSQSPTPDDILEMGEARLFELMKKASKNQIDKEKARMIIGNKKSIWERRTPRISFRFHTLS